SLVARPANRFFAQRATDSFALRRRINHEAGRSDVRATPWPVGTHLGAAQHASPIAHGNHTPPRWPLQPEIGDALVVQIFRIGIGLSGRDDGTEEWHDLRQIA